MRRYVIVGSGAAGFSAAESIRSHDPSGRILLISEDPHRYYSRPGLAYYLTGELPDSQLFPKDDAHYRSLRLEFVRGSAERLDPAAHRLQLTGGRTIEYDRLLIAVGASANCLQVPGAHLEGVLKLDNLEDARKLVKMARRGRKAVVVGGGITSLEIVEGLAARGVHVAYLMRDSRYWSNVLDETESRIVEKRLEEERVTIYRRTEMAEILEKRGRVAGILTKDGRKIPCQILAAAIGVRPRLELALSAGLQVDRGILVDENLQTSAPDVYAAGDVAQVFDPFLGKSVLDSLWKPACDQGRAAGANMAGIHTPYLRKMAFNVTRLANLTTLIIGSVGRGDNLDLSGIARGDSEIYRMLPDAIAAQDSFDVNHLRLLIGKDTLVGAVLMGDQTISRPLQELIGEQVSIAPIRDRLLQPNAPLGRLVADYWVQWKRNGNERC